MELLVFVAGFAFGSFLFGVVFRPRRPSIQPSGVTEQKEVTVAKKKPAKKGGRPC